MTIQNSPKISVCVCTYKRPLLLRQLLYSLSRQTLPLSQFEVIVVDNDHLGSAGNIVGDAIRLYPDMAIRYEVEPIQGISHARNRTIALANSELLAFIDDDENASQNWLFDLANTKDVYHADAVLGPVVPQYPADTSEWVINSKFFDRPRFATGTFIRSNICRTGNALIVASLVKVRMPFPFDVHFAQTGGEDLDLFRWLENQGCKFVWCDQAVVHEEVPLNRQALSYLLKQGLRVSANYWQIINQQRSRLGALGEALLGLCIGFVFAVWGVCVLPVGLHRTARNWVISAKGFGRVIALTEHKLIGYR